MADHGTNSIARYIAGLNDGSMRSSLSRTVPACTIRCVRPSVFLSLARPEMGRF